MVTLSTAASTNEAPDASAASMRMRMDWPAYGLRLADAVAHTASRSAAAPVRVKTAVVPPLWTMLTRRKSADDAYPIPRQVYGALGFRPHARTVTYRPASSAA